MKQSWNVGRPLSCWLWHWIIDTFLGAILASTVLWTVCGHILEQRVPEAPCSKRDPALEWGFMPIEYRDELCCAVLCYSVGQMWPSTKTRVELMHGKTCSLFLACIESHFLVKKYLWLQCRYAESWMGNHQIISQMLTACLPYVFHCSVFYSCPVPKPLAI